MKVLVISDVHGRTIWEDILLKERDNVDKIVFLGDYFDSYDNIGGEAEHKNFEEIRGYYYTHIINKYTPIILLLGNHDLVYLIKDEQYSRFNREWSTIFKAEILTDEINFKICHKVDNVLFSHAGITKIWCKNHNISTKSDLIEEEINTLYKENLEIGFGFGYNMRTSTYGNDITQSPVWVRPEALLSDKLDGYKQVVGHTQFKKISEFNDIIFTDVLGTKPEYCIVDTEKETFETKII